MIDYDALRKKKEQAFSDVDTSINKLNIIAKESGRVADVAKNAHLIIGDLDVKFKQATKLNDIDIAFLFFAVSLQCVRQYCLTLFKKKTSHVESAKDAYNKETKIFDKWFKKNMDDTHRIYYATLNEIISNGVPYDALFGSNDFNLGLNGNSHRFRTLGHDPILGWIFGTSNIMTSTLTDWKFFTYHVEKVPKINKILMPKIVQNADTSLMLSKVIERSQSEPEAFAASVIKQALHYESDEFSKVGLPIPMLSAISPDVTQNLAKYGIDFANSFNIGKQAMFANLINILIAEIHGLFFNQSGYSSWNLYQVKTRKIISYSNIIASASNVAYATITHDLSKLDIGGFLVALHRVITDKKFIESVKEEFLEKEFYNIVIGDNYNF
ncbi:hypothetical protein [Clostridium guangxiense]|uniref:hypothetical protein n=1 Tax=Clostridium guangxiense TaxID=1662055 RepID=UPI001E2CFDC6|nr:hypothetical protein [Clostridium guangxiense]MCD2347168.1 hypothetical protein [Clostridium guangxiense]